MRKCILGLAPFALTLGGCGCPVIYTGKASIPNSEWVLYAKRHDWNALTGDLEISAVNERTGRTLLLFHIDGDFTGRVLIQSQRILLLVDRHAEVIQDAHAFGKYAAEYRRVSTDKLQGPSGFTKIANHDCN